MESLCVLHEVTHLRHRDLKPENILVFQSTKGVECRDESKGGLLITDFDISKSCFTHGDKTNTESPEKGMFSAPEVFRDKAYRDKFSDIFHLVASSLRYSQLCGIYPGSWI